MELDQVSFNTEMESRLEERWRDAPYNPVRVGTPSQVYSPQLGEVFTPTEIKGNAIYTKEGACLSCKLVSHYIPIPEKVEDNQLDKTVNFDYED